MVAEVDIGGPEHGLLEVLEEVEETRHWKDWLEDASNLRMQLWQRFPDSPPKKNRCNPWGSNNPNGNRRFLQSWRANSDRVMVFRACAWRTKENGQRMARWWLSQLFFCLFTPDFLGKNDPIWRLYIFFRWVLVQPLNYLTGMVIPGASWRWTASAFDGGSWAGGSMASGSNESKHGWNRPWHGWEHVGLLSTQMLIFLRFSTLHHEWPCWDVVGSPGGRNQRKEQEQAPGQGRLQICLTIWL